MIKGRKPDSIVIINYINHERSQNIKLRHNSNIDTIHGTTLGKFQIRTHKPLFLLGTEDFSLLYRSVGRFCNNILPVLSFLARTVLYQQRQVHQVFSAAVGQPRRVLAT